MLTTIRYTSKRVGDMQKELDRANSWSKNSNLLMNPTKTKTKIMLFSTSQMSVTHNLAAENLFSMQINHQNLEQTKSWKVLEIKFNERLK